MKPSAQHAARPSERRTVQGASLVAGARDASGETRQCSPSAHASRHGAVMPYTCRTKEVPRDTRLSKCMHCMLQKPRSIPPAAAGVRAASHVIGNENHHDRQPSSTPTRRIEDPRQHSPPASCVRADNSCVRRESVVQPSSCPPLAPTHLVPRRTRQLVE